MLETIAALNKFHEDAGITEVSLWVNRSSRMCAEPFVRTPRSRV